MTTSRKTPENVPENEIAATFGKYKDRLAFSDSPEPGFRRRFASDLEVVTASFDDFFEKAKAEVTEEQLKAEYEKRVAEGRFDVKETTPPASTPPAETPPADKPAETTPPAEKPADMPAEKPAETPPADKPAETPQLRSQRKLLLPEKPAETPPADKPAETPAESQRKLLLPRKPAETPPAEKPAETLC